MSTVKFNTWQNTDGTENYKCRAWVNFNGTGTVAIRASGNVSSITDLGVGYYRANFTTAMPDANYAINLTTVQRSYSNIPFSSIPATTSFLIDVDDSGNSNVDRNYVFASVFR